MSSKIVTDFAVDDPASLAAPFRFDQTDRRKIDDQIIGIEEHLVSSLIRGVHATRIKLSSSSDPGLPGEVVCVAPESANADLCTRATSAALAAAGQALGVLLTAVAPGGWAHVALHGVLPPSLTGLASGSAASAVRVDTSTCLPELVTVLAPGDYSLGTADTAGNLTLFPAAFSVRSATLTITDTTIASDKDDYSPTGWSTADIVRLSSTSDFNITGLDANVARGVKLIINVGLHGLTFKYNSLSSLGPNRFSLVSNADYVLNPNAASYVFYDSVSLKWRRVS